MNSVLETKAACQDFPASHYPVRHESASLSRSIFQSPKIRPPENKRWPILTRKHQYDHDHPQAANAYLVKISAPRRVLRLSYRGSSLAIATILHPLTSRPPLSSRHLCPSCSIIPSTFTPPLHVNLIPSHHISPLLPQSRRLYCPRYTTMRWSLHANIPPLSPQAKVADGSPYICSKPIHQHEMTLVKNIAGGLHARICRRLCFNVFGLVRTAIFYAERLYLRELGLDQLNVSIRQDLDISELIVVIITAVIP
nr:hypothetical protein CFP56_30960 [Quercus suber]